MTTTLSEPPRILLVDDDDLVARSLRRFLLTQGFPAHVALEFGTADALMRENRYRVIVVDPYLTGAAETDRSAALEMVRGLQPHAALLLLTSYDSPALLSIAKANGACAVLRKPQSLESLARHIVQASRSDSVGLMERREEQR
jgi:ActR/RegA family two-component response regulator